MLNKEMIIKIFKKFENFNILCIGDIMVDEYIIGKTERVSQEAPVPIVEIDNVFLRMGGVGNVISNIVSLGGNVIPCGIIGTDSSGIFIKTELKKMTNEKILLLDRNRPTTKKTRIFSDNQQMLRVDSESKENVDNSYKDCIFGRMELWKDQYDAIIISDYQKGLLDDNFTQKIIKFGRENNKPIFVDPKGKYKKYKNANFITPNLKELSFATGMKIETDEQIYDAGMNLYHKLKIDGLIVTRGKDGISVIRNDGHEMITLPTKAKEVFDVSGAGDTVIATFALSHLSGLSMEESAEIANLAAGRVVSKIGTTTTTLEEILEVI